MGKNNVAPRYYISLIGLAVVNVLYKLYHEKQLSLDGAYYFVQILENQNFVYVAWARRFSEYLTEWPLVLAVRLGVTDIPALVATYGVGYLLPYLIGFLGCLYAVRNQSKVLMLFPLSSFLIFNLTGDYLLIGEHHIMVLLSWPILFLLISNHSINRVEGVLTVFLLILFMRLYETALIPQLIFLGLSVTSLFRHRELKYRLFYILTSLLLIAGVIISAYFILNPRTAISRDSFLDALAANRKIYEVVSLSISLSIFSFGWLIKPTRWMEDPRLVKNVFYSIALMPIGYYIYQRVSTDYAITSYWSFSSRSLSSFFLPAMLIGAIGFHYGRFYVGRYGLFIYGLIYMVMLSFNVKDTRNWIDIRKQMSEIVADSSYGQFVSINDTVLKNNHFRWSWNNPLLSTIWSYPCVYRVILNGGDDVWQPYDPKNEVILKEYIKYDSNFLSIDREIQRCGN